ncbi:hypothetical protein HZC21_04860 [Candidatus Peregrinibacteria bacterium]|nr:hypothetical protein [Candidatus Peregrinibacteria bacterium]
MDIKTKHRILKTLLTKVKKISRQNTETKSNEHDSDDAEKLLLNNFNT